MTPEVGTVGTRKNCRQLILSCDFIVPPPHGSNVNVKLAKPFSPLLRKVIVETIKCFLLCNPKHQSYCVLQWVVGTKETWCIAKLKKIKSNKIKLRQATKSRRDIFREEKDRSNEWTDFCTAESEPKRSTISPSVQFVQSNYVKQLLQ